MSIPAHDQRHHQQQPSATWPRAGITAGGTLKNNVADFFASDGGGAALDFGGVVTLLQVDVGGNAPHDVAIDDGTAGTTFDYSGITTVTCTDGGTCL